MTQENWNKHYLTPLYNLLGITTGKNHLIRHSIVSHLVSIGALKSEKEVLYVLRDTTDTMAKLYVHNIPENLTRIQCAHLSFVLNVSNTQTFENRKLTHEETELVQYAYEQEFN